jgi:alpha-1,4-N-acetylglucosaminyltransferase EXTL3
LQAQVAQREAIERNSPELALPKRLLPPVSSLSENLIPPMEKEAMMCGMHRCFDYSRCALTSGLPVYLYDPESYHHLEPDPFLRTTVAQTLGYNPHFTPDPAQACLFIVLVGDIPKEELQRSLPQLPYWRGDGRNHILLHLTRGPYGGQKLSINNLGRAMIAQSSATENEFRFGFDILVPPAMGPPGGDVWQECAFMLPARRRVLLTFQGELQNGGLPKEELDQFVVSHLQGLIRSMTSDRFILNFSCPRDSPIAAAAATAQGKFGEWLPCGTEASRAAVLRSSTYTLILAPSQTQQLATPLILARLSEALKQGAVPVILGDQIILPFSETLIWKKAVIFLPKVCTYQKPKLTMCYEPFGVGVQIFR